LPDTEYSGERTGDFSVFIQWIQTAFSRLIGRRAENLSSLLKKRDAVSAMIPVSPSLSRFIGMQAGLARRRDPTWVLYLRRGFCQFRAGSRPLARKPP
jgi:hypothetical protein